MKPHLPAGEWAGLLTGAVLGSLAILAGLANAVAYLRGGPQLEKVAGGRRGALSSAILGVLVGSYFVWVSMIFILPRVKAQSIADQRAALKEFFSEQLPDLDPAVFLRYVHAGAIGIDEDLDNSNALVSYLEAGNLRAAQVLLQAGAGVDAHQPEGRSPLLDAVDRDNLPAVQLLLAAHADPNLAADNLPIFDAVNPDPDPVPPSPDHPYTADDGDNPRPADTRTYHRREIAAALVSAGVNLNVRDERTYTPLMVAAATGQCDVVATLLAGHPDLTLRANTGETALDWAKQEHPECAPLLHGNALSEDAAANLLAQLQAVEAPASPLIALDRTVRSNAAEERARTDAAVKAQYRQLHPLGPFTGIVGDLFWSLVLSTLLYAFHRVRSFVRGDKQPVHWSWVPVSSGSSSSYDGGADDSSSSDGPSRGGSSGGGGASRDF